MGFLGGSVVKNLLANAGDAGLILGSGKIPWRRKWQLIPVFLPGKLRRQKEPADSSPWGCRELDTTWWLNNDNNNKYLLNKFSKNETSDKETYCPFCWVVHSSVLAWRVPWMAETGGLLSLGSCRVGHDWSDLAAAAAVQIYCHSDEECFFLFSCKNVYWATINYNGPNLTIESEQVGSSLRQRKQHVFFTTFAF